MRHRSLALAVVVAFVAAPLVSPAAPAAAGEKVLQWEYVVRVTDPASGDAEVTMRFRGLDGLVEKMTFLTGSHNYPLRDVRSASSRIEPSEDGNGHTLVVEDDDESFSFVVNVNKDAHKAGEYHSFLGADWGVLKAEAFSLGFTYSYLQGTPFRWEATVRFSLPSGWSAEMPYAQGSADGAFALPDGDVLPRGFVALGPMDVRAQSAAGKEFRYARLGEPLEYDADLFPYLAKSTPYYERVYGASADDVVLVVSAPSPMLRGGLGGTNSLFVHDESDFRTLAHEYAHVWQLFGTVTDAGDATVWLNEGDADYHSVLSLFVTDYWSLDEVNDFLRDYDVERSQEPFRSARLVDATYGTPLEDVAYHKGALVIHALDGLMRESSRGAADVADLLRALNDAHDQRVKDADADARSRRFSPVDNEEVLATVNRLVQLSEPYEFSPFFDAYVYGRDYPPFEPVLARENLVIANLTLTPERAVEGDVVIATVRVENRGIAAATKRIPLLLDGEQVDARDVSVGVGESADVVFSFEAPGPGRHQVRSFYLEAPLDVLVPARLDVARVTLVPSVVAANSPAQVLVYVTNLGELPGDAHVAVVADGTRHIGEASRTIGGNVTEAFAFPLLFTRPGAHGVEIQLSGAGAAVTVDEAVTVVAADADGDGVPDDDDAYPANAAISEKGIANDVKNSVPTAGALVAALAMAAVALVARRR